MSNFGPIAYEDFSQLNARWNEARPPVAGLGTMSGPHDYVDLSFLNAHYRPIWPATVGMSNGILSSNSLGIVAGLGEDPSYPWREYSADTKALQEATNEALAAHGYKPITADGKLGPATCGAIREMCTDVTPECSAPSTCQSFTAPTPVGSGGGMPHSSSTAQASMMGSVKGPTNWLLIGGAVAAIALGGAIMYKAAKK